MLLTSPMQLVVSFHCIIVTSSTYSTQKKDVVLSVKILADVVESYLAALTLDQGLEAVEKFLQVHLFPKLSVSYTDPLSLLFRVASNIIECLHVACLVAPYRTPPPFPILTSLVPVVLMPWYQATSSLIISKYKVKDG